ncbi:extensin-like [Penaeus japonicus]|uniref:extensin-like n=1 Tax=Penaeus japonicus TaxID=27405 RepID=UPI001C70CEFA|nr:extensin-like [Penaeus japonicus]
MLIFGSVVPNYASSLCVGLVCFRRDFWVKEMKDANKFNPVSISCSHGQGRMSSKHLLQQPPVVSPRRQVPLLDEKNRPFPAGYEYHSIGLGQQQPRVTGHQQQSFVVGHQHPAAGTGQHQHQFAAVQHHQIAGAEQRQSLAIGHHQQPFVAGHHHQLAGTGQHYSSLAGQQYQAAAAGQQQPSAVGQQHLQPAASQVLSPGVGPQHRPPAEGQQYRLPAPSHSHLPPVVSQPYRYPALRHQNPVGSHPHPPSAAGYPHYTAMQGRFQQTAVATFQHLRPAATPQPRPLAAPPQQQPPPLGFSPNPSAMTQPQPLFSPMAAQPAPGRPFLSGDPVYRSPSSYRSQDATGLAKEGRGSSRNGTRGTSAAGATPGITGTSLLRIIPDDDTLGLGLINPNELTTPPASQFRPLTPSDSHPQYRPPASTSSLYQPPPPLPPSYSSSQPSPLGYSSSQHQPPMNYPSSLSPFRFSCTPPLDPQASPRPADSGRQMGAAFKPTDSAKYRVIREQNNAASRRYREAQRGQRHLQEEHLTRLLKENQDLRARVTDLEKLRNVFKDILDSL